MQLPNRRRRLAVLSATIAAIATTTPAIAAPTPADATASALLDAFAAHQIVALGQVHDLRQEDDFIVDLLHHPRFAETVDSIVVEFGNARFQSRVDRYIVARRPRWRRALLPPARCSAQQLAGRRRPGADATPHADKPATHPLR